MNRLRSAALAVALITAFGCQSSLLSPDELIALNRAESLWRARSFADYTYEIQQLCFCPPEINRWTRVTVRGGAVVDAVAVEPDPSFPVTTYTYWQPIDSVFARVRRATEQKSSSSAYSDVIATYDAELGFPTRVEWVEKANVADAAAILHLRNVRSIN
jgi:hypothetical protein